jgi:hypothetical protein
VARTPNYNYEKRRKELERKAKKEAKAQRKSENAEAERSEPATDGEPPRVSEG